MIESTKANLLQDLQIQDRLVYVAVMILGVSGALTLVLSDHVRDSPAYFARFAFAISIIVAAAVSYLFARHGLHRLAAGVMLSIIWLGVTAYPFVTGFGLHTTLISIYIPAILYAAFVLGARAAILQTALTIAALAAMYWAEDTGRIVGVTATIAGTTTFNQFLGIAFSTLGTLIVALTYYVTVRSAAERIRASHDEVSALNETLEARVAERTRELEAFNYSVAHDLRTPLRAINGYTTIALREHSAGMNAEGRRLLERAANAANGMDRLLMALLDLNAVGRRPLACEDVDLSVLCSSVVSDAAAQEGAPAVQFAIQPGLRASCDPRLLRDMLTELIGNALKFGRTSPNLRVEFGTAAIGDGEAFFVRDNGVGFDPAFLGQLFKPFHRLHAAVEFEGVGIGLARVQRIVERHGGKVWAVGRTGEGATFYFTLSAT